MKFLLTFLLIISSSAGKAQYVKFAQSGIITYEKRANMYALIKKSINKDNEAYLSKSLEQYKKNQPQFKTSNSTLTFQGTETLYKPQETDEPVNRSFFLPAFEQNNIVYSDLAKKQSTSQKNVFEKTFLVKDSLRNIRWKITDETREIAGFECRRANAIIMDSIYVVAFYTDEIITQGGPESFTGLPGMILGVALPHEHINWFATKVVDTPIPKNGMIMPNKGTIVNNAQFKEELETNLKLYNGLMKMAIKFYLL